MHLLQTTIFANAYKLHPYMRQQNGKFSVFGRDSGSQMRQTTLRGAFN
jgi:hypothetical protein